MIDSTALLSRSDDETSGTRKSTGQVVRGVERCSAKFNCGFDRARVHGCREARHTLVAAGCIRIARELGVDAALELVDVDARIARADHVASGTGPDVVARGEHFHHADSQQDRPEDADLREEPE